MGEKHGAQICKLIGLYIPQKYPSQLNNKSTQGNGTKLQEGTKLHENKIARSQIFTKEQNCTKTILHQGSILHGLHFCTRVKKYRKIKQKKNN